MLIIPIIQALQTILKEDWLNIKKVIDINSYTYNRRPVQFVFCESFISPNEAIELEKQIKGWSRKKKEALIARDWNKLKDLVKCKNQTSHKYFKNG